MVINNSDLEFLIHLENRLGSFEEWSDDVRTLWALNEKLINQRNVTREKTRKYQTEKRKNPEELEKHRKESREYYARKKKKEK